MVSLPTRALAALVFLMAALPCQAASVAREIVTPKGLHVWLMEDHSAPLFTLGFRFAGGSALDPAGKEGLANVTAEMFLQGAGALPADAYLKAWSELGAEAAIEARNESVRGTLKVLSKDRDEAADLLALAFAEPRITPESLEDVREQVQADIERMAADPELIGYAAYGGLAYGTHPLARQVQGAPEGVDNLTPDDILHFREATLTRAGLTLSAVGDITAAELGPIADRIFAGLPEGRPVAELAQPTQPGAQRLDIPMAASEAEVVFGVSLGRLRPRERAIAELLNYTLGGSAFTSRLYRQIRDRRGLAYSIGTTLDSYSVVSEITGTFGAEPGNTEQAIQLTRDEFSRLATDGPSDAEVTEARAALAGQYLRGLIKQVDLANELTLRMSQGFAPDYVTTYAARLAEIAPEEVRQFARAVPWLDRLVMVTVGARSEPGGPSEPVGRERSRAPAAAAQEP
jgi:zinc protease